MEEPLYESPWNGNKEWWVLNPGPFIDICFNLGIQNFVFTEKIYRFIANMRLAPNRLLESAARGRPWRAILVEADYGDQKVAQVAVEYTSEQWFEKPVGVYPIWSGRQDAQRLIECVEGFEVGRPIGRFFGDSFDMCILDDQEMRVLIKNPPVDHNGWNQFFTTVSRVKRDHPDITFHIHGGKNLSRTLGTGVDAFDHPVRTRWVDQKPKVILPNGREIGPKDTDAKETKMWASFIGLRAGDIYQGDNTAMGRAAYEFSLRSIKWACGNYEKVWKPGIKGLASDENFDYESSDIEWRPLDDLIRMPKFIKRERFDLWLCDVCSLALSCPYSRPGAVCIVDESETAELAAKFRSRKSSEIIDGLGSLIDANVKRLNRGMLREIDDQKIDPNVTKLVDSIFDRGVQLAKMVDPILAGQLSSGTKVNVGVLTPGSATRVAAATPQELMAGVAKALRAEGIAIEDATPDDVERVLGSVPVGEVIDVESSD